MSQLPHDKRAEQSVLGAALIDPDGAATLPTLLDAEDYHLERHQRIHDAICRLAARAEVVDVVTVSDELGSDLDETGGPAYLAELMNATPTALYQDHYARIVQQKAALRRAIAFGQKVAQLAYDGDVDEAELAAQVEEWKREYLAPRQVDRQIVPWQTSVGGFFQRLENEEAAQEEGTAFDWPWPRWNQRLGEFPAGLTMQILGDDGTGKTQVADLLADHWSRDRGKVGGYITTDMPRSLVEKRRAARHTNILTSRMGSDLSGAELQSLVDAHQAMLDWPGAIHYAFEPELNIDQACRLITTMHEHLGIDYVVLDNLNNFLDFPSPRQLKLRMNETQRAADNANRFIGRVASLGLRGVAINQLTKHGKRALSIDDVSKEDAYSSGRQSNKIRLNVNLWRGYAEATEYGMDGEILTRPGERSKFLHYKFTKVTQGAEFQGTLLMTPEFYRMREIELGERRLES